jgi:hypothetical protein
MREAETWFQKGLELEETERPSKKPYAYEKVTGIQREPPEPWSTSARSITGSAVRRSRALLPVRDTGGLHYALAQFTRQFVRRARQDQTGLIITGPPCSSTAYADAHFNLALLANVPGTPENRTPLEGIPETRQFRPDIATDSSTPQAVHGDRAEAAAERALLC